MKTPQRVRDFFVEQRRIFAGILCVFQENPTKLCGKISVCAVFEDVNADEKKERG